jgi:alpha-tubulin suppressor-like RCC1 family protein
MWSWGLGTSGQLGDGAATTKSSPVQIGTLSTWLQAAVGQSHSIAIKSDGTMWGWGANGNGQVGDNTVVNKSSPVQIGTLSNWVACGALSSASYGQKSDGTLWAWGLGNSGNMGAGYLQTSNLTMVQVGAQMSFTSMSTGPTHAAAIDTNGFLYLWGSGGSGEMGNQNIQPIYVPNRVTTDNTWVTVACGASRWMAIKAAGTLFACGAGSQGQNGTVGNLSSPTQIGALTNWAKVTCGGNSASNGFTVAVKTDGTLWTWGDALLGKLGNGTTTPNLSSPVQVGTLTNWAEVSSGASHTLAVKTDGTLWAWGSNVSGRLGDSTTSNRSSPVQIGTLTNWSKVCAGTGTSWAIKTDGTLWSWGAATDGSLGDGTITGKSSPVQVGTLTSWLRLPDTASGQTDPNQGMAIRLN